MSVTTLDHPLVKQRLGQLRTQPNNPTFRHYTKDLCRFLAYEALRELPLQSQNIQTWSGETQIENFTGKTPTAIPILRAGLGMLEGFLDIFPDAPVSMMGIARNEETLEPMSYYNNFVRDISERTAYILDPMLATGGTTNATISLLKNVGCRKIYGLFLISSVQGIENVEKMHPDVHIYTCGIDAKLNDKGYIIPGLGDAGDLIFGTY